MSEGHCRTCRWWQPPTADDVEDFELRDFGRCGRIGHPSRRSDRDWALAEDAEGYNAWLRCLPNFGCVLWESKEEGDGGTG